MLIKNIDKRQMLATIALTYANGPLHLGHLVEAIQADIWVRYQKMRGHECFFIGGDDTHGAAIMLAAEREGLSPEAYIAEIRKERIENYQRFLISFDDYGSTHTRENQQEVEKIYQKLCDANVLFKKNIAQYFDPKANMFLPDRFIRGTCPKCEAPDQYGDNCEVCGATYEPTELTNAVSTVTGTKPVIKHTEHFLFDLASFTEDLQQWAESGALQDEVYNKLQEWFSSGLQPWDITRDAPYFGFPIPNHPDKYFYVWLDAPIAYLAIFKAFCEKNNIESSNAELYHFVGKDIAYFHTLFWPAVLMGAHLRLPTAVYVHGFLTIDGQKMSKSRGTFIKASTYADHLPPEYLRYYFAAKLSDRLEDIDLNLDDFMQRINADIVGKVINIASRCAMFINKHFDNQLSRECIEPELFQQFVAAGDSIALCYDNREYNRAVREIMQLADRANQYIDEQKPWALLKEKTENPEFIQEICTMGLNLFLVIMTYLKPVLPMTAQAVEAFFNIAEINWDMRNKPLLDHEISAFTPLLQRIKPEEIAALKQAALAPSPTGAKKMTTQPTQSIPEAHPISIEEFAKIDLRIGRIMQAEHVEGADKLLKLQLDLGADMGTRQVFAGIKAAYPPEELIDKLVVVVANLAPRQMRFGLSEGMVLASGPGGENIWLISPDAGAEPGMKVK